MNAMNISQASTVLNAIVKQATGQGVIGNIATPEDFVSVAQTALLTGADSILNAISQVWARTIFSVREYDSPLSGLEMDLPRYGNAIRKLSPVAKNMYDDLRFKYPVSYDAKQSANPLGNGQSVDHYKIDKQEVVQTNFYGTAVYQQRYTIFRDNFDAAFNSLEEFERFNTMNLTERYNDYASFREGIARGVQANMIGAILDEGQEGRVIHLLTEYNEATGQTLTAQTVYKPENFPSFMRWVYARIRTISRMFGERSQMFQTVINGKPVLRHTPARKLRIALYAQAIDQMEAMVTSTTYHDNYLQPARWDYVPYWQSIETPDSVAITPVYTSNTGELKKGTAKEQAGIFGIIHDVDAIGFANVNSWTATTPLNIDGGYWNTAHHATIKTISDNTEKVAVLLLD